MYVDDKETIADLDGKLPNIWITVNHYYDHYIEDNIKDFFKTKDQLLKEAMNTAKAIYEQTDKISTSIVASIVSILVLLVTTLYRSFEKFSVSYTLVFMVVFISFSIFYYWLTSSSSKKRYLLIEKQFDCFISEISLLQKDEIKQIKKTYLKDSNAEMERSLQRLLWLFIIVNSVMVYSFLVYMCVKYNNSGSIIVILLKAILF